MSQGFPYPVHIGTHLNFLIAAASDVIAAVFVIVGLATRPSAFFFACNILVAWVSCIMGCSLAKKQTMGKSAVYTFAGSLPSSCVVQESTAPMLYLPVAAFLTGVFLLDARR